MGCSLCSSTCWPVASSFELRRLAADPRRPRRAPSCRPSPSTRRGIVRRWPAAARSAAEAGGSLCSATAWPVARSCALRRLACDPASFVARWLAFASAPGRTSALVNIGPARSFPPCRPGRPAQQGGNRIAWRAARSAALRAGLWPAASSCAASPQIRAGLAVRQVARSVCQEGEKVVTRKVKKTGSWAVGRQNPVAKTSVLTTGFPSS